MTTRNMSSRWTTPSEMAESSLGRVGDKTPERLRAFMCRGVRVSFFASLPIRIVVFQIRCNSRVCLDNVISDSPNLLHRFIRSRFIRIQGNAAPRPRIEIRPLWVPQRHVDSIFLRPNVGVNPFPFGRIRVSPPRPDTQSESNARFVFCDVEESIVDRVRVTIFTDEAENALLHLIATFTLQAIDILAYFQCVRAHFRSILRCGLAVGGE